MSGRFLIDLADVLRRAGLPVQEVAGWQTRARSSGGFASGQPSAIVVHHTASGPSSDGRPDATFCATGSSIAPVYQVLVDRTGTAWVLAAGAANNAGRGGPWGPLPVDGANTRTIAVCGGNNGVGEPWPVVQTTAMVRACAALCQAYGIPSDRVLSHDEWTSRKIDPAGPSPWATGSRSWGMPAFRADVAAAMAAPSGGGLRQGEAYDVLTLFYASTPAFAAVVGPVQPSGSPGGPLTDQGSLFDVFTLWHAVNPGIVEALERAATTASDGGAPA